MLIHGASPTIAPSHHAKATLESSGSFFRNSSLRYPNMIIAKLVNAVAMSAYRLVMPEIRQMATIIIVAVTEYSDHLTAYAFHSLESGLGGPSNVHIRSNLYNTQVKM